MGGREGGVTQGFTHTIITLYFSITPSRPIDEKVHLYSYTAFQHEIYVLHFEIFPDFFDFWYTLVTKYMRVNVDW